MRKYLLLAPVLLALANCTTTPAGQALTGAGVGAAIGAAVSDDDDRLEGAAIGAVLGGAAGTLIGRTAGGNCVYADANGRQYTAACR